MPYPHKALWINNREVVLESIRKQTALPEDAFEANTFEFLQQWFDGTANFTLHTSGSTGSPKPIQVTRSQLEASAQSTLKALGINRGNAMVCLDTRFIAGKMMLVRSLLGGLQIHAYTPAASIVDRMQDLEFELAAWVPMQVYEALASDHAKRLNNIGHLLIGGAPLSAPARLQLMDFKCQAYLTYGMTETISHVAILRIDGSENPRYQALPGVSLEQDSRGCLVIHAPYLLSPIVTNDLVDMQAPNQFHWRGRWDNVINTGGVKVIPEALEAKLAPWLQEHNFSGDFFVSGLPHARKGQEVALFLEGAPEKELQLDAGFRKLLTAYEIPRQIIWVESFVRTESGKTNRTQTIALYSGK